jgi:hypothetical protein
MWGGEMKSKILIAISTMIVLLVNSIPALACACCADKGAYQISVSKPDTYQIGLFKEMKFASNATLFTSDAGVDESHVKGLPNDYNDDNYQSGFDKLTLGGSFAGKTWTLNFTDYKGRKGSLLLALPSKMLKYAVDLEPDKAPNHGLYKEFRFEGIAKGRGFLQSSITPSTKFFLVFRGEGNACDNASDFKFWRVEITGTKARYAFWGKMESAKTE